MLKPNNVGLSMRITKGIKCLRKNDKVTIVILPYKNLRVITVTLSPVSSMVFR